MKILIVGGTRFVGLAITKEAVSRAHEVTIFHRDINSAEPIEGVSHIIGDRDSNLSGLTDMNLSWDVTIDVCAYRPHQVDSILEVLGPRAGKYVYISTVSVYAEDTPVHSNEITGKLVSLDPLEGTDHKTIPIDRKTYGPLKLLCEKRAQAVLGDSNILIVRPTYVFGPGDYTMRFPKWIAKIRAGGVVKCPNPINAPFQYIDARDQAAFVIDIIEGRATGVFNCCITPEITFGKMLEGIVDHVPRSSSEENATLQWEDVPEDATEFTLWSGTEDSSMMSIDASKAVAMGLKFRPYSETILDTLRWMDAEK